MEEGRDYWSDIAYDLVFAFVDCNFPVKLVAAPAFIVPEDIDESRWSELGPLFNCDLDDDWHTNIYCGFGEFGRYWTDGKRNIAYSGPNPRPFNPGEVAGLKQYSELWCPEWGMINKLGQLIYEIPTYFVRPDAYYLEQRLG